MCACVLSCFSCVWLFATPWTVAHQAPLSIGFPRRECWSGSPCPPPGDLPNLGVEPVSPVLQEDSLPAELLGTAHSNIQMAHNDLNPCKHSVWFMGTLSGRARLQEPVYTCTSQGHENSLRMWTESALIAIMSAVPVTMAGMREVSILVE